MWDSIYPSTDWVESHIPAVSLLLIFYTWFDVIDCNYAIYNPIITRLQTVTFTVQ